MYKNKFLSAAVLVATVGALAGCGSAGGGGEGGTTEFQLATFVGPSTPYGEAIQEFATQINEETDGRVEIEIFWDGSLLAGDEILSGVESGRVGMGYTTNAYNPTELPLSQLVSIPFQANNTQSAQEAWNMLLESDEAFAAEWEANNVVNLGIQSVSPMIISGKDQPTGVDWIDGKSIRATSYTGEAVQLAGGSPVGLTINELYESMERGVIEGYTSMNLGTIPSLSLHEVSPYVADPGLGIYSTVSLIVNADVFAGLTEEDQQALRDGGSELGTNYLEIVNRVEDEACTTILDAGGDVTIWEDSEVEAWKDLIGTQLMDSWKSEVSSQGLDGDAFAEAYTQALETTSTDEEGALERCANR